MFAAPRDSAEYIFQMFEREMKSERGLTISKNTWTPYLGRLYRRTEKGFEVKIPEKFWQSIFNLVGLRAEVSKRTVATPYATSWREQRVGCIVGERPLSQEALHSYRVLTGKLIRAGGERPELLYAVQELRRHFDDPKQSDLTAAKRLTLYLLGTLERTLQLEVDDSFMSPETLRPLEVHVASGATWTSTTDRCLTSGGALWVEGFLLHAWSEAQHMISQSNHEVEFVMANLCAREGLFVMSILEEIGLYPSYTCSRTAPMYSEGQRVFVQNRRTIPKKEFWFPEMVRDYGLSVISVPDQLNVADVFVKALPRERFEQCMNVLGMRGSSSTARWGSSQ